MIRTIRRHSWVVMVAFIMTAVGISARDSAAWWWSAPVLALTVSVVLIRRVLKWRRDSDSVDLSDCSAEHIGYAWQITTLLLHREGNAGKLRLVRVRQQYLDELVRRDPAGMSEWLSRAARGEAVRPDLFVRS